MDREREYHSEKSKYAEAVERKCRAEKWYDLDLLECVLFVPVFGLFLPFFGIVLIGTVRSRWGASYQKSRRNEVP
jgi:hypothetical protein